VKPDTLNLPGPQDAHNLTATGEYNDGHGPWDTHSGKVYNLRRIHHLLDEPSHSDEHRNGQPAEDPDYGKSQGEIDAIKEHLAEHVRDGTTHTD